MVRSIKMLQTSHIVFVDYLVEEFIDQLDRERTDGGAIHGFGGVGLALREHGVENVIIQVDPYLVGEVGPRLTDVGRLEDVKHFLPCGSPSPLFCENTLQGHFHVGMQARVYGTEPDDSRVESLSIESFPLDRQKVNKMVAFKGVDILNGVRISELG